LHAPNSFEGIPEWFLKFTLPAQRCAVAEGESWESANRAIGNYLKENQLKTDAADRKYVICERYNLNSEISYAQYSHPLVSI
jgi:hypothetical protein